MSMRTLLTTRCVVIFALLCSLTACKSWDPNAKTIEEMAAETVLDFKREDPEIGSFFKKAYGYAIFPTIGKGALIAGGGGGKGLVFEKRRKIGSVTIAEFSIGLQAGGQKFSQIIFFEDETTLNRLKESKLEFGTNLSAVALKKGVARATKFTEGLAIFILPRGGLMAEAAIGGQSFSFTPEK